MNARNSLSIRLSVTLVIAMLLCATAYLTIIAQAPLFLGDSNVSNVNRVANESTRALVAASLIKGANGFVVIEPGAELRAKVNRDPYLLYAAFDPVAGIVVPGSNFELADRLRAFTLFLREDHQILHDSMRIEFKIAAEEPAGASGAIGTHDTPFGPFIIAAYGSKFGWRDTFPLFANIMRAVPLLYGFVILFASLVIWFAVRRGLAPLRAAADGARAINMDSLEQRLSEEAMPSEVLPLVRAVNDALDRLGEGVVRQRRFIANAAHQLCTPIAILRSRLDDPRDEGLRSDLRRDLRRLQAIVEQLLVSARLGQAGEDRRTRLDLAAVVREKIADYAPLMRENRRSIRFEGPSAGLAIAGDRRALESVVANLIDNALQVEPEGGTLVVRLSDCGELEVVDHGEGVAEQDREKIFEAFWRKSETRPGTGLGLAIVREIIEAHGGCIDVRETPGGGATFRILFCLI